MQEHAKVIDEFTSSYSTWQGQDALSDARMHLYAAIAYADAGSLDAAFTQFREAAQRLLSAALDSTPRREWGEAIV